MSAIAALRRADPAGLVVAALLFGVAAVILWDASRLTISSAYGLGPQAAPIVIAAGLFVLGIGNLMMAIRRGFSRARGGRSESILLVLGGLAALEGLITSGADSFWHRHLVP